MDTHKMKLRTKQFAIDVALFLDNEKLSFPLRDYAGQLIRCSASVGANYRAACRAKSLKDFINKMKIVEEEGDESMFFLEIIAAIRPERADAINKLHNEANEIVAMTVAAIKTSRIKLKNQTS